ncbi:MAG: hypothetical protein GWN58_35540 [Anaerolineae bacterium]|nr:hypothetical protein [Anaerolineae bacterium]
MTDAVLANTEHGLVVGELHAMHPTWEILGDMLDHETVGLFNPLLPPYMRFVSGYWAEFKVSELAKILTGDRQ